MLRFARRHKAITYVLYNGTGNRSDKEAGHGTGQKETEEYERPLLQQDDRTMLAKMWEGVPCRLSVTPTEGKGRKRCVRERSKKRCRVTNVALQVTQTGSSQHGFSRENDTSARNAHYLSFHFISVVGPAAMLVRDGDKAKAPKADLEVLLSRRTVQWPITALFGLPRPKELLFRRWTYVKAYVKGKLQSTE